MNNTAEEEIKGGINEMGRKERSRQTKNSQIASYTLSSFSSNKVINNQYKFKKTKSNRQMKLTKSSELLSLLDNSKKQQDSLKMQKSSSNF